MIQQIVVGFADADTARDATREAANLAFQLRAKLHIVSAVDDDTTETLTVGTDRFDFSASEHVNGLVNEFMTGLGLGIEYTVEVREGSPGTIIIDAAERVKADLIVVGNVRMQGVGRLLGSVGNHVTHHAPCSVMIVKTV
jgi:nucleotide-binding universal stress UspA family protein